MYRYETHCHTLYASACSSLDAETMVALYLANGYDGIVVTDHFFNGNTAISPSLGWKERVGAFYGAYMNVRKEGEKRGLKVFFGFEYSYSGTDFLAYGMGPDFLCAVHPGASLPRSGLYRPYPPVSERYGRDGDGQRRARRALQPSGGYSRGRIFSSENGRFRPAFGAPASPFGGRDGGKDGQPA